MTYHTTEELIGGRSEWAVSPNNFNGLIDSHILANQRISELEAQLDSVRALLAAEMQAVEKLGESRDNLNAALQVAREALETIRIGSGPQGELAVEALARMEEAVCGSK